MKWLTVFLLPLSLFAREPFFTLFDPPKDWLISDPSKYEKGVKVAFIASTHKMFAPSITLTIEKVGNTSIKTYTKALERIYRSDLFQELGTFKTSVGTAHLFQIDRKNQWGEIRILQAIVLFNGYALIQTGACLKKDFLEVHQAYLKSYKSLRVTPSLIAEPSIEKRVHRITKCWNQLCATSKDSKEILFDSSFFQTNQWKPFVNYIEKELESKGICWQFLVTKHVQETLLSENET